MTQLPDFVRPGRRQPPLLKALILALSLALPGAVFPASDPGPSPFAKLESDLRRYIAIEEKALSSKESEPKARQALQVLHYYLHDIRNHKAFWEMWNSWAWKKDTLRVLYPASGSHLAPLVFLYGNKTLKEVSYTFTEVDQSSPVRMQALLRTMERGKMCSGVTLELAPMEHAAFQERWAQALASKQATVLHSHPEVFISWYLEAVKDLKTSPGFMVDFRFTVGSTRARIHMLISVPIDREQGSTAYYQQRDFKAADLIVTHDWDSSPRTNLEVVFDLLNSSRLAGRKAPLAIMMEDLRRYPFPVDMALFNPVAASTSPYGHQQHAFMPDGKRLEQEDGPALYEGGVILEPDLSAFNPLPPPQLETLFNLLLFAGQMYDRRNVDVIDGCVVAAPPLLDLGAGYGHRDIRGRDLRTDGQFAVKLVEGALMLLESPFSAAELRRVDLCALVSQLARSLKERSAFDAWALLAEWDVDQSSHPFLKDPKTRKKYTEIFATRLSVAAQVERDSAAFRQALDVLERNRDRVAAACGPGAAPAPVPVPHP